MNFVKKDNSQKTPQFILGDWCSKGDLINLEIYLENNNFINYNKILNYCLFVCIKNYRTYGTYIDCIKLLISKNIDVNFINQEIDMTPLMFSINKGIYEIVKLLIENKVNINIKNNAEKTAIFYALNYREEDKYQIIDLLIKNNAELNIEDKFGDFPLLICIKNNDVKSLLLLLKGNININKIDYKNSSLNRKKFTSLFNRNESYWNNKNIIEKQYKL